MIQHPGDGKGAREVRVDGRKLERVLCVDPERGVAIVHSGYCKGDKIAARAVMGRVEVRPL